MDSVLIGIAGLCFGVLMTRSRIPRFQLLPLACLLVLAAIGVAVLIQMDRGSLLNALVFTSSALLAACIYGAELWKRNGLDETFSTWRLIWMSAFRPGYLRAVYEQSEENSEVEPGKTLIR